jgi:hypothetical protein
MVISTQLKIIKKQTILLLPSLIYKHIFGFI